MSLDKAAILAASDLKIEAVPVPEWGGTVHVRRMTGTERDVFEIEAAKVSKGQGRNIRALLVGKTLCDSEGNRMFADNEVDQLGAKSGAVLDRLFDVSRRLSGLTPDDVKELEKN